MVGLLACDIKKEHFQDQLICEVPKIILAVVNATQF